LRPHKKHKFSGDIELILKKELNRNPSFDLSFKVNDDSATKKIIGNHPNTYSYTKALTEDLVIK